MHTLDSELSLKWSLGNNNFDLLSNMVKSCSLQNSIDMYSCVQFIYLKREGAFNLFSQSVLVSFTSNWVECSSNTSFCLDLKIPE